VVKADGSFDEQREQPRMTNFGFEESIIRSKSSNSINIQEEHIGEKHAAEEEGRASDIPNGTT
jgi:hypothetical protein